MIGEMQKVPGWSNVVKASRHSDTANGVNLQVVLIGSVTAADASGAHVNFPPRQIGNVPLSALVAG